MAAVKGAVQSVVKNVHEAVIAPVKDEVVTDVKEAAKTIISGPTRLTPQEQQQIIEREQDAKTRAANLRNYFKRLAAQEHQIRLTDAARKKQEQQAEAPERDQATVRQFKITDKPILQVQSKRVPGIPGGNVLQKQTAPERTRKAA